MSKVEDLIGAIVDRLNAWSEHMEIAHCLEAMGFKTGSETTLQGVRNLANAYFDSQTSLGLSLSNSTYDTDPLAAARDRAYPLGLERERASTPDREGAPGDVPPQFQLVYVCKFCHMRRDEHIRNEDGDLVCVPTPFSE